MCVIFSAYNLHNVLKKQTNADDGKQYRFGKNVSEFDTLKDVFEQFKVERKF